MTQLDLVRVRLLGGLVVELGGRQVGGDSWPTRRSAELVALLALGEGHRLVRDRVVDLLWPHLDPDAGAANLRKAAHHARQALGDVDAVRLSGGLVALFPGRLVDTDVADFDRRAREAVRMGDRATCAALDDPGELLPEWPYEEWTRAERDRLRTLYLQVLRCGGRWERLVELEPADEDAYCELMRAAVDRGDPHAAIRWFGRLRTALRRELGLPPSRRSRELYARCVDGLEPTAVEIVGRQDERARMAATLRGAERGELGALVVRGPGGIGKTTLCRELGAAARDRGWQVLTVAATPAREAYAPVTAAIEQLLQRDHGVLATLSAATRATLAALTGLAGPATADVLTRHRVVGAVHRLLTARPDATGVLLVLDDAHLADEATVELWDQLARAGGAGAVLVVAAYRAEGAPASLTRATASLQRAGRCVEIDLGPLDDAEIALLVAGADDPTVERIVAMAHGNPFFALELRRGTGDTAPSAWAAITERFVDLDEVTRSALRRLAVVTDVLDPVDVPALAGLPEPETFALLDAALAAGALVVSGTGYRFRHELVRQALAAQVLPHHRITFHRDTARRLGELGADPALVARHWLDGGRPDEAVPWLLAATRRDVTLGALEDALGRLEPLLAHAPAHPQALCIRAEVLDALGDRRAPAAYAAAAAVVGREEAHDLRAMQALAEIKQGDPARALQTLDGLQPVSVPGRLAQALALSGAAVMGFADPALGTVKAAECRRLALATGERSTLVVASWAQAAAAHARDDLRRSIWEDLLDTHALRELAISVFDGHLCMTQRLLYGARPYPDVVAFADSFLAEAERLGAIRGRAFALTLRGEAKLLSGALDAADDDLRLATELSRTGGGAVGEALAVQRRAEVAVHRGDPAAAADLLDEALAVARESDVGFHLFDRIYGARIAAAGDPAVALARVEEAERAVRGPLETCPGCRITLAVPAAIASARAGDRRRAERHGHDVRTLADVVMRLPGWSAAAEEVSGHLALAAGDQESAGRHFRRAADAYGRIGQVLDQARCVRNVSGTTA
ncbi:ATP-binding protein [Pseudonocardia dioxanivorans]|uniref:ATP-binding protein n=1 Tax=Pseudonocardia dioxanivorans TaxID=240495 RepID=UPI0018F8716A|nr:AAA family ATPase [Pseudonocardia dioxanivorans]